MERFSVILFSFYSFVTFAGLTSTESSTTIETLWDNAHDIRDIKNHVDPKQRVLKNNTKYPLIDENSMNSTQIGEYAKDLLYLNNASNAFTNLTDDFSSSNIKDAQHSRHNADQKDDVDHKEKSSIDLSSHDILLDPSLISARLTQTEKGDIDYSNLASIENISSNFRSNNHDDSRSVLSKWNLNYEGDLNVAEDRYRPPYPYWNPYYRKQFPNRANDRRERYRNYWRYPVFPGK